MPPPASGQAANGQGAGGQPAPGLDLLRDLVARVRSWDWLGSTRVAVALLGTSAVLTLIVGLGLRPGIHGIHYTFRSTVAFFAWLWCSIFGAHLSGGVHIQGASNGAHLAAWPLTLTVITFAAGIWTFRRATATITSPLALWGFIVRTAVITAVPLTVVSWFAYAKADDVLKLGGTSADDLGDLNGYLDDLWAGPSSSGAFWMTLLTVTVVLGAVTLLRPGLYGAAFEKIRPWLTGPIHGIAALVVALIPAGMIGELAVYLLKPDGHSATVQHLTWHENLNLFTAGIAYAVNSGAGMLSVGSLGKLGADWHLSIGDVSQSVSRGLWWLTGHGSNHNDGDAGFWVAVVLAPVVLGFVAWYLTRSTTPGRQLGTWLVSLLVVLPLGFHLASIGGGESVSNLHASKLLSDTYDPDNFSSDSGIGRRIGDALENGVPDHVSATGHAGIPLSSMWLVLLYAVIIAFLVALFTGVLTPESLARMRTALAAVNPTAPTGTQTAGTQAGDASASGYPATGGPPGYVEPGTHPPMRSYDYPAAPQVQAAPAAQPPPPPAEETYQVGDVVNGHRYNGEEWIPTNDPPPPPGTPVYYLDGDVVNGHRFDGNTWIPMQ